MSSRKCRCGCNEKVVDVLVFPSGRKMTRQIKCGYCGQEVNQINARHDTGKWFHTECVSDHANFYKAIMKLEPSTRELKFLKDYILTQMIMRKDLRQLHKDWGVLSRMNALPLALKPKLNPEIMIFQ